MIVEKANLGKDGASRADGHFQKVFFTNAGAEAVENAIRMAKGHTGRLKVLSTYRSYHGGTAAAIGLTGEGRRLDNEPSIPGLVKFWGPYAYRSAFHADSADAGVRAGAAAPPRHGHVRGRQQDRRDHPRIGRRHERHPRSRPTATSRASGRCATSSAS